jgi:hypothetical protein
MALNEVRFPQGCHRKGWSEQQKNLCPEFEQSDRREEPEPEARGAVV